MVLDREFTRTRKRFSGKHLDHMERQTWRSSLGTLFFPMPVPEETEKFVTPNGNPPRPGTRNTIDSNLTHNEYLQMLEDEYGFPTESSVTIFGHETYVWEDGFCPYCEASRHSTACRSLHQTIFRELRNVLTPCCVECGAWVTGQSEVRVPTGEDISPEWATEDTPDSFDTMGYETHTQNNPCGHTMPVGEYEYFPQALVPGNPKLEDPLARLELVRDETTCPRCENETPLDFYMGFKENGDLRCCEHCGEPLEEAFERDPRHVPNQSETIADRLRMHIEQYPLITDEETLRLSA